MYGPLLLDHFEHPRNAGKLAAPAITVEASNPVCGDILRLSALFDGGSVTEARFQAKGCTACVAMGSVMTEVVIGRDRTGLQQLTAADIEQALGGLINESKHVAVLGVDAVRLLAAAAPEA